MSETREVVCEYCGEPHDVRALCAARSRISRRRFFSISARAIVGAAIAPAVIEAAAALAPSPLGGLSDLGVGYGTYGGINRATFAFWRNQQYAHSAMSFDDMREKMREVYNACSQGAGPNPPTAIELTDSQGRIYAAYEKSTPRLRLENAYGAALVAVGMTNKG